MLPKIRQQKGNNGNIDPEVKEELEYKGRFSDISNEFSEEYGDLLSPSNEANQPLRRKRNANPGMAEKDYSSDSEDEKDDSFDNEIGEDESDSSDIESEDEAAQLAR